MSPSIKVSTALNSSPSTGLRMNFWKGKAVLITGGAGFVGSHLCDKLGQFGCTPVVPRSVDYDLRCEENVVDLLNDVGKIDVLFHLAANVGGIGLNQAHPATLLYDNAMMGLHLLHEAQISGRVGKIVLVGTVCAYPKFCPSPFDERNLWDGYPEETNAPYGLAKKLLLVYAQSLRAEFGFNAIYLLPTNLYGPRDNFDYETSHVVPALIRRFIQAREAGTEEVEVWGTGRPSRDFLYVGDAVEAMLLAAERYDRPEPLNLGSGHETTIIALTHYIQSITNYTGKIVWDVSRPDGQPRRVLNSSAAKRALGWTATTSLLDGLEQTIAWYEETRCQT